MRIREAEQYDIEQEKIHAELHRIQRHLITAQSASATDVGPRAVGGLPHLGPRDDTRGRQQSSAAMRASDGELEALWLGGRVQAEHELQKLARALHTPSAAPVLPLDIEMAVDRPQSSRPAVLDEISRIDRFLHQATACR